METSGSTQSKGKQKTDRENILKWIRFENNLITTNVSHRGDGWRWESEETHGMMQHAVEMRACRVSAGRWSVRMTERRVTRMQSRAERQLRTKHNNTRTERVVRWIRHSWEKDRERLWPRRAQNTPTLLAGDHFPLTQSRWAGEWAVVSEENRPEVTHSQG